jgi:hypothetical protein
LGVNGRGGAAGVRRASRYERERWTGCGVKAVGEAGTGGLLPWQDVGVGRGALSAGTGVTGVAVPALGTCTFNTVHSAGGTFSQGMGSITAPGINGGGFHPLVGFLGLVGGCGKCATGRAV